MSPRSGSSTSTRTRPSERSSSVTRARRSGRTIVSRLRSNPAASRGRGRAPAGRAPVGGGRVFVQAPKSDVYVAMLGVALGAIIIGSLLLLLRWRDYDFAIKPGLIAPFNLSTLAPVGGIS